MKNSHDNTNNSTTIDSHKFNSKKTTLAELACKITKIGSFRLELSTMKCECSDEIYTIFDLALTDNFDFNYVSSKLLESSKSIFETAYQETISLGKPFDLELMIITEKGQRKWVRFIAQPVTDNGAIVAIEGAIQDITEARAVFKDNALENQTHLLNSFFKVSPDIYFVFDVSGQIYDYRASKDSLLYTTPEQFLGKKISEVMPPNLARLFEEHFQRAIETKRLINYEYNLETQDGLHHFESRICFLPGTDFYIGIVRDITDQYITREALKESEARFRSILALAPFPLLITRLQDGQLHYGNERAKYQLQFNMDEEIDLPAIDLYFNPEDRKLFTDALHQHGYVNDMEFKMRRANGEPFWALMSATLIEYENEPAILTALNDITARKEVEEAVRLNEEKYRLLTEYMSDVIWVLNLDQARFTYISPSIEQLRGYTVEEAIQQTMEEALTPESLQLITDFIETGLARFTQNPQQAPVAFLEIQQPCKNGDNIWVEVSAKLRFNQNNEIEVFGVSRNIEERKKMEKEVLFLSYHDQLTGLYNRRFFEEKMKLANNESNLPFTLIIADVNGLKLTNDAFGHLAGDTLLTTLADILKTHCRENDMIARIGGDEFIFLLPRTTEIEAEKIVNRIKDAITSSNTGKYQLSVSFGWKTKYTADEHFDIVFKHAEDFMYRNKLLESNSFKGKTIKIIATMLNEKYPNEKAHSERVSKLCVEIGQAIGLNGEDLNELAVIGLLHDIGKIGIDEQIINKTSELSEDEYKEVKRHPEIGYQILRSATEYAGLADAVLTHHERIDGKGFPKGIKGPMIPMMAKILSIAECYDTMLHPRKDVEALSLPDAIQELKASAGTHFDTEITKVFIEKVLGEHWN